MRRFLMIFGIGLLLALVLMQWGPASRKPSNQNERTSVPAAERSPLAMPASEVSARSAEGAGGEHEPAGSNVFADPRWVSWNEAMKKDSRFQWRMPISFYGEVVDYDTGDPLAAVEVTLTWNDLSLSGTSSRKIRTDEHGKFVLENVRGKILQVSDLKREGYVRSRDGTSSFEYAAFFDPDFHVPDRVKPVVFRMKKLGTPQPMFHHDYVYELPPDGTECVFDLRTGQKFIGGYPVGDLAIQFKRGPNVGSQKSDWTMTMRAMDKGGFVESQEEFMFEAPKDGYTNSVVESQLANDPSFGLGKQRKFYCRLADGETYARMEVQASPAYGRNAAVRLIAYVNSNRGSRNLEFDPTKRVIIGPDFPSSPIGR